MLKDIKDNVRNIPSGKASSFLMMYVAVVVLGMPAMVDGDGWFTPVGITMQQMAAVWNKNYNECMDWDINGFMMNASDVQAFITRVREQQKEISLTRLDVLSIEDRQTLLDAKNLGLLRIVEFKEINVDDDARRDAELDIEGENEFVRAPNDPEHDREDL
jgi:hypothetical protein